jgi:hypothetical protein
MYALLRQDWVPGKRKEHPIYAGNFSSRTREKADCRVSTNINNQDRMIHLRARNNIFSMKKRLPVTGK